MSIINFLSKLSLLVGALLLTLPHTGQTKPKVESGAVLQEYLSRQGQKDTIVAQVQRKSGKPFIEWGNEDYAKWMSGLDLDRDEDLWKWAHVTGITIVGVTQRSTFFFCNAHLLENIDAAVKMPYEELVSLKRGYDPVSRSPTLHSADGQTLRIRDIPAGTIRQSTSTDGFSHDKGYAEPRTVFEVLAPYLVKLSEIPNRSYITRGLQALPLSIVKAYRGNAIYLTTRPGRSYAVGMPVSNSVYKGFAGMQSGFFLDPNTGLRTTHNVVHELGHVIDYVAISGRYGRYLHSYQIPSFQKLKEEKDRIFGKGDAMVPQTNHGYISRYAKANAQESFAEHFAGYILEKERFRELAEKELTAGHAELMEKYKFLEALVDHTPVIMIRLSQKYVGGAPASLRAKHTSIVGSLNNIYIEENDKGITIRADDATLNEVLKSIESKTGIQFHISPSILSDLITANLNVPDWQTAIKLLLEPYGRAELWNPQLDLTKIHVLSRAD
jgi:hypothetical protein